MHGELVYRREERGRITIRHIGKILVVNDGVRVDPLQVGPFHARSGEKRLHVGQTLHLLIIASNQRMNGLIPVAQSDLRLAVVLDPREEMDILLDSRWV